MIGTGLSLTQLATRQYLGYSPGSLFSAGEQGVWYDPSDFSTMFQDAAGATPVTAVEQPVGLILDKSKGLVLGPNLSSNPTYETGLGSTAGGNGGAVSWDGINKRAVLNNNSLNFTQIQIANTVSPLQAGRTYQISIDITNISCTQGNILLQSSLLLTPYLQFLGASAWIGQTRTYSIILTAERWPGATWLFCQLNNVNATGEIAVDNISVRELPGNHATQTTATSRPVLSARVNLLTGTETLATQTVTTRATTQTLRFEGAGTVTLSGTATGTYSAGSHSVTTTAGNLTLTVSGTVTKADLRAANMGIGLPAYQSVNTSTDYDTAGFPHYLRFDGVDDWLVTPSIDFTSTDKMTVFAGVRKLSDAAAGLAVELSAAIDTNNSAFSLVAASFAGANSYRIGSKGTIAAVAGTGVFAAAPDTSVLTGVGNISGDVAALRRNGLLVETSTTDQGTGNYGNYPLYIGRRAGTTFPFNGHIYSLIVRGAQSREDQIIQTEKFVASKTGINYVMPTIDYLVSEDNNILNTEDSNRIII